MKNIQIKFENNNICAYEFVNLNSKNVIRKMKGKEVYDFLNYNTRYPIKNIYENGNGIQIEYENFIVSCDKSVLSGFYISPLIEQINRYSNRKNAKENRGKRVSRQNKHIGKKVVAVGVMITIICGVAALSKKKKNRNTDQITTTLLTQEYDENSTSVNTKKAAEDFSDEKEEKYELRINYSDFQPDYDKLDFVRKNYGKLIEKYSKMYGIDPNIMIAIATQERGVHSSTMDSGGATGLMQIQNVVWVGENLKAFNYEKDDIENVLVTNDMLSDLENNIKIGCMVFANTLSQMNNNVLATIQCYNMGYGNMMKIFDRYSMATGKNISDILDDPSDIGWLDYRDIIEVGDSHYLDRILAYIGDKVKIDSMGEKLVIDTTASDVKAR